MDDVFWVGPSCTHIDTLLNSLKDDFDLTIEASIQTFLESNSLSFKMVPFNLPNMDLLNWVLQATGMLDSNPDQAPTSSKPLGLDKDGAPFREQRSYTSVVGMWLYLGMNSCPEITYTVHQCDHFTHAPKHSHAKAIKCILHYLNATNDKGIILHPSKQLKVDCFIDANFAGLWNSEDPHDLLCTQDIF